MLMNRDRIDFLIATFLNCSVFLSHHSVVLMMNLPLFREHVSNLQRFALQAEY